MSEVKRQGGPEWEFLGIQALRGVAALAVVLGHSMNFLERGEGALPAVMTEFQGAVGVDLFFIISGFVMTISSGRLLGKQQPARIFLWRRLLRIAPLYWILTTVKLALVWFFPVLEAHHMSPWNVIASFLFVPSINGAGEIRPVITLGWTLNFEMAFYLLFACSLGARRRFLWVLLPMIGALGLLGLVRTATWPAWTSLADPIVLEFAAGVLIAVLTMRRRLPNGWMSGVAVGLGCAGLIWIKPGFSPALRAGYWGLPAALVVLGTVGLERALHHRLPRWVLLLGSASYSIYLVQIFVFPVVDAVGLRLRASVAAITPWELGVGIVATSFVGAIVAGVATHLVLERPLTELLKQRFGAERIAPITRATSS